MNINLNLNIYGLENKQELSKELEFIKSDVKIEEYKETLFTKIARETAETIKELENEKEKEKITENLKNEMIKFILEQYYNTNIFKVIETKEFTSEIEIIKVEKSLKYNKLKEINEKYAELYKKIGDEKQWQ